MKKHKISVRVGEGAKDFVNFRIKQRGLDSESQYIMSRIIDDGYDPSHDIKGDSNPKYKYILTKETRPIDVDKICKDFDLTSTAFADKIGVSTNIVHRWRAGDRKVGGINRFRIEKFLLDKVMPSYLLDE